MKTAALAIALVLLLAACRDDTDGTPPVGHAADGAGATAAFADGAGDTDDTTAPLPRDIDDLHRLATEARVRFDAEWLACGDGTDDDGTRCRDEAVRAWDAAMRRLQDTAGAAAALAPAPGVLAGHDELAVVQVTGTRG